MRLLADENLHADLVAWLRANGHDAAYAAESLAGKSDEDVLRVAREQDRVVVTDDGVVLVRLRDASIAVRIARLATVWPEIERSFPGRFVAVGDHKVRARPLPGGGA